MGIQDKVDQGLVAFHLDADVMTGVESVTYTPATGSPRTIKAIVDRLVPEGIPGGPPQSMTPRIEISIRRDAAAGAMAIDRGGDRFTVADVYGGTARARTIAEIVSEDAGMIRLLLR